VKRAEAGVADAIGKRPPLALDDRPYRSLVAGWSWGQEQRFQDCFHWFHRDYGNAVAEGVKDGGAVTLGDDVRVSVEVELGVLEFVGEAVLVGLGVLLGVAVGVELAVGELVPVAGGVAVFVGPVVMEAVAVCESAVVAVAVPVEECGTKRSARPPRQ
jgi:hypothetical protein